MVVQILDGNHGHASGQSGAVGLHVGEINVRNYFPRHFEHVELALDHLLILCPLDDSFWRGCPEIHDVRLSLWLESKRNSGKLPPRSASVAMIPAGGPCFKLQMIADEEIPESDSEAPAVAYVSQIASPLNFDRRKQNAGHDSGRKPERRTADRIPVVRLKSNASASTNA